MAKAHNLLVRGQLSVQVGLAIPFLSDLSQHVKDTFISAAMKRALERSNGCCHAGINIGQG